MAAYRRVYGSRHLQADCQAPGSARNPTLREPNDVRTNGGERRLVLESLRERVE